jgi:hypothetical protein
LGQEVDPAFVENARLAERYVDSYKNRDLDGVLAVLDEDVVTYPLPLFGFGPYSGHTGVREWWAAMEGAGVRYDVVVRNVRQPAADRVAVLGELHSGSTGALLGPWALLLPASTPTLMRRIAVRLQRPEIRRSALG